MPYPDAAAGVSAVLFPDPVAQFRTWAKRFTQFERVYSALPARHAEKLPFVIVRESGGAGVHDRIYSRARLQFECWADDSGTSSENARTLAALLLAWDEYADVWNPVIIQDPTYMPDPDSGLPVHRLAAEISFVGEDITIL